MVLVQAGLSVQSGSFCTQLSPAEGATLVWNSGSGSLIASNRFPRASYKESLIKAYTRVFADLPNIYKQIQRSSPNRKTKKHTTNEIIRVFSRRTR